MSTPVRTAWIIGLVSIYSVLAVWIATGSNSPQGAIAALGLIVLLVAILAWRYLVAIGFILILADLIYLATTAALDYGSFHGQSWLLLLVFVEFCLGLAAFACRVTSRQSYGQGHHH
jgi:hypothetical protein